MQENLYAVDYIRRAITSDALEKPDIKQAGRYIEPLSSLYDAHAFGGPNNARNTLDTGVRRFYPELIRVYSVMKNVYLSTALGKIPEPAYLIDGIPVYEACLNVLVGPRGVGKSFIALHLAKQIGRHNRVLYIAAEGVGFYNARVRAWHAHHGEADNDNVMFHGEPVRTTSEAEFNDFVRLLIEPWKPVMVVVDTVAACMVDMDENNSTDMKKFVDRWQTLTHRGIAVLFVHHTNRKGHMRGSNVLDGAMDSILVLSKPTERGLMLRGDYDGGGKNRGNSEPDAMYFMIQPQETPGYTEDNMPAVAVRATRKMIYMNEVGEKLSNNQCEVLRVIADAGSLTVKEITDATKISSSTVYHVLSGLTENECIKKVLTLYEATDKGKRLLEASEDYKD